MRPHGTAKHSDELGRYYTSGVVSDFLIRAINEADPKAVVDLGAGEGALSVAASRRWGATNLATVDLDERASRILSQRLKDGGFTGAHHHVSDDALGIEIPALLKCAIGFAPRLAVCNPPFFIPKWKESYGWIAEDAGLSACLPVPANTDSALLFLAQNLRLVDASGTIGLIIPDSLASAEKYLNLRRVLLREFVLEHCIKLPKASFHGTEAQAHIWILKKGTSPKGKVKLSSLSFENGTLRSVDVDACLAERRLDADLYLNQHGRNKSRELGDIVADIRRGSANSAQVRESKDPILHTTDITEDMRGEWVDLKGRVIPSLAAATYALPGDILIARVGRNAIDKVIGVASGSMLISDCIFRIRVPKRYQRKVLSILSSSKGREWLRTNSHGVAAKHISKTELLRLPLDF